MCWCARRVQIDSHADTTNMENAQQNIVPASWQACLCLVSWTFLRKLEDQSPLLPELTLIISSGACSFGSTAEAFERHQLLWNLCDWSPSAWTSGKCTRSPDAFVERWVWSGVYPARRQDSSVGGDEGYVCLGVVHMEEGVQDRLQVEVGREEQGEGETHGKGQNEDTTRNKQPLIMDGMNMV